MRAIRSLLITRASAVHPACCHITQGDDSDLDVDYMMDYMEGVALPSAGDIMPLHWVESLRDVAHGLVALGAEVNFYKVLK